MIAQPWYRRYQWWIVGAAVLVVIVVGSLTQRAGDDGGDESPDSPVELCSALADPSNLTLHASDWRRITDWSSSQLVEYVARRCPEHLDQVR